MDITPLDLPGVMLVRVRPHGDARGWFAETWREDAMAEAGIPSFVQDNQSFSAKAGTVRGLHYQLPPSAQAKLVRAVAGRALDVAVDLRTSSPTFGQHIAVELDAGTGDQLFIPEGFAHGFCTLTDATMLSYKVSRYYSKAHDRSLLWHDESLAIRWPVSVSEAIVSDKDRTAPRLADIGAPFA